MSARKYDRVDQRIVGRKACDQLRQLARLNCRGDGALGRGRGDGHARIGSTGGHPRAPQADLPARSFASHGELGARFGCSEQCAGYVAVRAIGPSSRRGRQIGPVRNRMLRNDRGCRSGSRRRCRGGRGRRMSRRAGGGQKQTACRDHRARHGPATPHGARCERVSCGIGQVNDRGRVRNPAWRHAALMRSLSRMLKRQSARAPFPADRT